MFVHLCILACNSSSNSQCSSTVRASVFPQAWYLVHLSPRISTGAGGVSLWVTWCEKGGRRGYGTPSRDRDSTCRGVTKIKVPLTPVGPMGCVALYRNNAIAPAPPPSPPHSQASKQLSITMEKQVESSVCVCVSVCFMQLGSYGCCYNKNKEILPLF